MQEAHYSTSTTQMISEKTGIPLIKVTQMVGGVENTGDYFALIDNLVKHFEGALKK